MISRYTVVQYLPHPLADERVNIGVIAWDETGISTKFIANWKRVQSFGHEDIGYVRAFTHRVSEALSRTASPDLFKNGPTFDAATLEKIIGTWRHNIQLTAPRPSMKDRVALLGDVVPIFLPTHKNEKALPRSRRTAAKIAAKQMQEAVASRDPKYVSRLVKTNLPVAGACANHEFPVALANGHAIAAVETLSFEIKEQKTLELEFDAICWTCADVKSKNDELELAVFVLTHRRKPALFGKATKILRKLDVALVTEDTIGKWAHKQAVAAIPAQRSLVEERPRRRP